MHQQNELLADRPSHEARWGLGIGLKTTGSCIWKPIDLRSEDLWEESASVFQKFVCCVQDFLSGLYIYIWIKYVHNLNIYIYIYTFISSYLHLHTKSSISVLFNPCRTGTSGRPFPKMRGARRRKVKGCVALSVVRPRWIWRWITQPVSSNMASLTSWEIPCR